MDISNTAGHMDWLLHFWPSNGWTRPEETHKTNFKTFSQSWPIVSMMIFNGTMCIGRVALVEMKRNEKVYCKGLNPLKSLSTASPRIDNQKWKIFDRTFV